MLFEEMFQEYINKGWHYANPELYNKHLDYKTNQKNGCDLPKEGVPVIVFNPDRPTFYTGWFCLINDKYKPFTTYETSTGKQMWTHVLWTYMPDFCYE